MLELTEIEIAAICSSILFLFFMLAVIELAIIISGGEMTPIGRWSLAVAVIATAAFAVWFMNKRDEKRRETEPIEPPRYAV